MCPSIVTALLYGCGGSEGDFQQRTEKEGSYCYLSIPLLNSDEPPLSRGLREGTDHCSRNETRLTIGWDANVHHII